MNTMATSNAAAQEIDPSTIPATRPLLIPDSGGMTVTAKRKKERKKALVQFLHLSQPFFTISVH